MIAIRSGRRERTGEDWDEAVAAVKKGVDQVEKGFARELDVPFGLRPKRGEE